MNGIGNRAYSAGHFIPIRESLTYLISALGGFFQRAHCLCIALSSDSWRCFGGPELKAVSRANGNAGRLFVLVETVYAVVAFDSFSCFGVPLRGAPWAGRDAGFTSDTE